MSKKKRNKKIFIAVLILVLAVFIFFLKYENSFSVKVENFLGLGNEQEQETENKNISPLSGLPCDNYNRRPIAVMLANDAAARPLSGLSETDMVFEMQVVEDSITRLMAIFICNNPVEIGSIRSARHDFIPLAMGMGAIYAHWGGSHFALEKLRAKITDNIDAMINPYEAFFRKLGISAPHNGFSSIGKLTNSAKKLGYKMENEFEGYGHAAPNIINSQGITRSEATGSKSQMSKGDEIIKINYAYPWNVEWEYDIEKNSYMRFRGGKAEIDKNNNQQVEAKNIIVMYAKSRPFEGQYNDVDVEGEGEILVFRNGEEIKGKWEKNKNNPKSKLYFLNEQGQEIKFIPGQIWVEIIEPGK